ncbi:kinase-like domain-containing protein [Globomyces pollinis-pini]|nr:kinase-like domain-containing protein [Globomyces pollinis-pini]
MQKEFEEQYELKQILGTGAFSEVKLGIRRKTGEQFAIKIVDRAKCKGKEDMIETEVKILQRIEHPNIVKLYEIVTGGELFDQIVGRGSYPEKEAAEIVRKILLAINYLHEKGIVHRDLKPENLLLSEKSNTAEIKISDFGLSKIFNEVEVMKTACGTPGYVAPEVLKRQGYGQEVDLWSLGVITYILLCGYPPFFDQKNAELFKKIMAGRYQFDHPWWDHISDKAKDFVRKLLVVDIKKRYTAVEALNHPFIVHHCIPPPPKPVSISTSPITPAQSPATRLESVKSPITIPKTSSPVSISPVRTSVPARDDVRDSKNRRQEPDLKPLEPKGKKNDVANSNDTVCQSNGNIAKASSKSADARPDSPSKKNNAFSFKVSRLASWIKSATLSERPQTGKK